MPDTRRVPPVPWGQLGSHKQATRWRGSSRRGCTEPGDFGIVLSQFWSTPREEADSDKKVRRIYLKG
jgi:hypothetical protein